MYGSLRQHLESQVEWELGITDYYLYIFEILS
jgi:hypothetical protein